MEPASPDLDRRGREGPDAVGGSAGHRLGGQPGALPHAAVDPLGLRFVVVGDDVLVQRLADDLLGGVAEHLLEGRVDPPDDRLLVLVLDLDGRLGELLEQHPEPPALLVEPRRRPGLIDGIGDAVRQQSVLFGAGLLLEVVGHPGRHRLAGDRLASLSGEEDERDVGVSPADRLEELQAVHPRHVVVRDDAVERLVGEPVERGRRLRLGRDRQPRVLPLEEPRGHLGHVGVVVDVEYADGAIPTCHAPPFVLP